VKAITRRLCNVSMHCEAESGSSANGYPFQSHYGAKIWRFMVMASSRRVEDSFLEAYRVVEDMSSKKCIAAIAKLCREWDQSIPGHARLNNVKDVKSARFENARILIVQEAPSDKSSMVHGELNGPDV
jgi:hypothetical protein